VPCSLKPRAWKRSVSTWPCTLSWSARLVAIEEEVRVAIPAQHALLLGLAYYNPYRLEPCSV
jgi:hypothetical protein